MDAKVRTFEQARRNVADGISLLQTAEASLSEISGVLSRLRELAVQAANDSNSAADRAALDNEATELLKAIEQVSSSAEFNGRKLLGDSGSAIQIQSGIDNGSMTAVSLELKNTTSKNLGGLAVLNTGGKNNPIFAAQALIGLGQYDPEYDANADGNLNIIDVAAMKVIQQAGWGGAYSIKFNGVNLVPSATFGAEVGHVTNTNHQNGSAYAQAKSINASGVGVVAEARPTEGRVTYAAATANFTLSINNVVIFQNAQAQSLADMVSKINAKSEETGVAARAENGDVVLTASDGRNINITGNGQGFIHGHQWIAALKLTSSQEIQIEAAPVVAWLLGYQAPSWGGSAAITTDDESLDSAMDLSTRPSALDSLLRIDSAIESVLKQRSELGATQVRLESMSSQLSSSSEALSAARARIQDADFAAETALLARNQILQQASIAIRAQAHVSSNIALGLLK